MNLDAMDIEELWEFWKHHQKGRRSRELFPNGGRGTRTATNDLANYAANKATAKQCRLDGATVTAMSYERICDTIYERLPAEARW